MSGLNVDELREHIIVALDEEHAKRPKGWLTAATTSFHGGTAKETSEWIAFAIMAAAALISQQDSLEQEKQTPLPHIAFPRHARFSHHLPASRLGLLGRPVLQRISSREPYAEDEPDDWQPGSLEGGTNLGTCRQAAGLDRPEWRILLLLWIAQFVTQAVGSLLSGTAAYGIMTALDNYGLSDLDEWNLFLKFWPYATAAFFIIRSTYQMITHRDGQARKFFFP